MSHRFTAVWPACAQHKPRAPPQHNPNNNSAHNSSRGSSAAPQAPQAEEAAQLLLRQDPESTVSLLVATSHHRQSYGYTRQPHHALVKAPNKEVQHRLCREGSYASLALPPDSGATDGQAHSTMLLADTPSKEVQRRSCNKVTAMQGPQCRHNRG